MKLFKIFITFFMFLSCNNFFITDATEVLDPKQVLDQNIEEFFKDYENEYLPQDFAKTISARPEDLASLKACEIKFKTDTGMKALEKIFNEYERVFEEVLTEDEKQIYKDKLSQIVSTYVKKKKLVKTLLKENQNSNHLPVHNQHKFSQDQIDEFNQSIKDGIETALPKCGKCLKPQGLKEECEKDNEKVKKLSLCSRCQRISYCSKECQKLHWPLHKLVCKSKESRDHDLSDNKDNSSAGSTNDNHVQEVD